MKKDTPKENIFISKKLKREKTLTLEIRYIRKKKG